MNKISFFFIFINYLLFKTIKGPIDITGHDLLDIYVMHLFARKFKLYNELLTNPNKFFHLLIKNTKKIV